MPIRIFVRDNGVLGVRVLMRSAWFYRYVKDGWIREEIHAPQLASAIARAAPESGGDEIFVAFRNVWRGLRWLRRLAEGRRRSAIVCRGLICVNRRIDASPSEWAKLYSVVRRIVLDALKKVSDAVVVEVPIRDEIIRRNAIAEIDLGDAALLIFKRRIVIEDYERGVAIVIKRRKGLEEAAARIAMILANDVARARRVVEAIERVDRDLANVLRDYLVPALLFG